ncbi:MAG: hypothetical protein JXB35_13865, partial [Anaerolineae bacterium]|nr:hypothetical protein [Anaerolineae bacterium]
MHKKALSLWIATALLIGLFTPLAPSAVAPVAAAPSTWCLVGGFQGWNNTSDPLYDDGTHGDFIADDGIFTLEYTVATAGRDEWKIVECGNWDNAYPGQNAWVNTTVANQVVKFTFDANDHSADAGPALLPAQYIVNAWDDLPTTFTAVGDFNGWNNADPAAALTDLGNGLFYAALTIATPGGHIGKVTATGTWDAFGADGRSKDAANVNFTTTVADEIVAFLLDTYTGRLIITPHGAPVAGNWCVAGGFQGWNNSSHPLHDDGANGDLIGGDGIFSADYAIATPGREEWKVFTCGTWDGFPSDNAWVLTSVSDQVVKFTFDANDHSADAGMPYVPTQNIVNAWDDFPTAFTAVGDWQGWDPGNAATAMTELRPGIFMLEHTLASIGTYQYKATETGGWDNQVGADGRNKNAPAVNFETFEDNAVTQFWLDLRQGRIAAAPPPPPEQAAHDNSVWWDGLYHDSRDPLYRTPGGSVPTGTPVTLRFRAFANDLTAVKVRLWDDTPNVEMLLNMEIVASDADYDWWEVTLPASAEGTIYYYRFIPSDGTDTDYYEDEGQGFRGGYGGAGQPYNASQDNSWQITIYDPAYETPDWVKDAVVYQIFADRFRDGDITNDPPPGSFHYGLPDGSIYRSNSADWNEPICDPRDPGSSCPNKYGENFYGGDLQGIVDKLDYLQSLGVTALYLNPIFESPSNHKYDTTDFSIIDDNFGDLALFQTLAVESANRGINLILDGVFNHTSSDSIYFDRYGRYPEVGACESETSPYRNWYYFTDVEPGEGVCVGSDGTPNAAIYESWWGYDSLPRLRSLDPEVQELIWTNGTSSIGPYWIDEGGDGWRFDVAADVDPGMANDPDNMYWEGFRDAIHTVNPESYMVGEEWGNSTPWLLGHEWDASMNYQFGTSIMSFWRDEAFTDNDHNSGSSAQALNPIGPSGLEERLRYLQERYPPEAWYAMMNLLGSHDTNRALFMMDHNADLNDRSIYEDPNYDWSDAITRLKGVALLQFTLPGAPTVYYGDEVGLVAPPTYSGGRWEDDPYNRIPYPWLDETGDPYYTHLQTEPGQADLRDHYTLLATTRNVHAALRTGSFDTLLIDDPNEVYAYGRKLEDNSDAAIVIANKGGLQTVTVDVGGYVNAGAVFVDVLNGDAIHTVAADGMLTVADVPEMSGALLVLSDTLETPPDAVVDLAVTVEGSGELDLGWSAATGATSYDVYRSLVSGGGFEFVANVAGTTYTDTGLENATWYYYVVVSKNDTTLLESGLSNEAMGMPHDQIGWANLQWPANISHTIGITPTGDIYGQVWIDGVTGTPGGAEGLWAQVGFGPDGSDPAAGPLRDGNPDWTWAEAMFNANAGNNDEFKGQLTPEMIGTLDYAYRYSTTGGRDWIYADLDGIGNGYDPAQAGALDVAPSDDVTAPAIPLNLQVIDWSAASITTEWDPVADPDLYAYDLYRYGEGETPCDAVMIARILAPDTTYEDISVMTGHTYTYTVRSLDTSFNRSTLSNEASGTAVPKVVEVHFIAEVPEFTPPGDTIYIAGDNADVLGASWNP